MPHKAKNKIRGVEIMSKKIHKLLAGILTFAMIITSCTAMFGNVFAADKSFPDGQFNQGSDYLYQYQMPASIDAPGETFSPIVDGSTANGAPVIATITESVAPGESIIVSGKGFANGKFYIAGLNTGGAYQTVEAKIIKCDDTTATIYVDESFRNGVYLVWAENSNGMSYPVRVNNPTRVWIGDSEVTAGQEVSLFGRNVKIGNTTPSVYLDTTKLQVTYSNSEKVTVKIPDNTANGTYTIYLHNGTGGDYGWAEPITLTVGEDIWKNSPVVRVSTVQGIKDAIQNAQSGSTILLAAGTYEVKETIFVWKSLRFKGESVDNTIIVNNFYNGESPVFQPQSEGADFAFEDITFMDANNGLKFGRFLNPRTGRSFHMNNCKFVFKYHTNICNTWGCTDASHQNNNNEAQSMYIQNIPDVSITNCVFDGDPGGFGVRDAKQVKITGNTGYGGWVIHVTNNPDGEPHSQGAQFVQLYGCSNVDVSNNYVTAKSVAKSEYLSYGDRTYNRYVVVQGTGENYYLGENISRNTGHPCDNSGEFFLFEDLGRSFMGNPTSVSGKNLTFSGTNFATINDGMLAAQGRQAGIIGKTVAIISGTGSGQYRLLESFSGNTFTVDKAWDVAPDSTSVIAILYGGFSDVTVHGNDLLGPKNYHDVQNAMTGVQGYAPIMSLTIKNNSFGRMHSGIFLTPMYAEGDDNKEMAEMFSIFYNTILDNNNIDETYLGLYVNLNYTNKESSVETGNRVAPEIITGGLVKDIVKNLVVKNNTIKNTKRSPNTTLYGNMGADGIHIGSVYRTYAVWGYNPIHYGSWITDTMIENNTIINADNAGVRLPYHQGDTILKDNVYTNCGAEVIRDDMSRLSNVAVAADALRVDSSTFGAPIIINGGGSVEPPVDPEPEEPEDPVDPSIGSGIVSVNKDFGSAEGWTVTDDTVTVANGVVTFTGEQDAWKGVQQVVTLKANTNYRFYYKASLEENTRIQVGIDPTDGSARLREWNIQSWDNGICSDSYIIFNSGSVTEAIFFANSCGDDAKAIGTLDMLVLVEVDENGNPIDVDGNIIEITDGDEDVVDPDEPGEGGGEVVVGDFVNGDFSNGSEGWIICTDDGTIVDGTIGITDGKAVFTAGSRPWVNLKQTFRAESGAMYNLSLQVNLQTDGIEFKIDGAQFEGTWNQMNYPGHFGVVADGTTYTVNVPVLVDKDSEQVTITFKNKFGTGVGWLDNISFVEDGEDPGTGEGGGESGGESGGDDTIGEFVNGDFSNGSEGWVICTDDGTVVTETIAIADGKAVFSAGSRPWVNLRQTFKVEANAVYKIRFDTEFSESGIQVQVLNAVFPDGVEYGFEGNMPGFLGSVAQEGSQTVSGDFLTTSDTVTLIFKNRDGACDGWIDNITITKVGEDEPGTGEGGEEGGDDPVEPSIGEFVNGDFSNGSEGWVICTDDGTVVTETIAIADGKAVFTPGSRPWVNLKQTFLVESGATYNIAFDIALESDGVQFVVNGGKFDGTWNEANFPGHFGISADGTTQKVKATVIVDEGSEQLTITFKNRNGACVGWIDNITVTKEGEEPEEPEVPVDPSVGSGMVSVNKDFANADGWTVTDSTITVANGVVTFTGEQANWTGLTQRITLKANTNYRIYYKASLKAGTRIQIGVDPAAGGQRLKEWNIQSWDKGICSDPEALIFNSGNVTDVILYAFGHQNEEKAIGSLDMFVLVEVDENGNPIDLNGAALDITDADAITGDLNEDYKVDLLDIVRMKKVIAGLTDQYDKDAADVVGGDDIIDAQDLALVKKYVLGFVDAQYILR